VSDKMDPEMGKGSKLATIIGKGTQVNGDLTVESSIRVDGKVTGNITVSDTLVLGKEGEVTGQVHAKFAMLGGKVHGNVNVANKVLLESNASVIGDIKASILVVDEGAVFDGKCSMRENGKKDYKEHGKG
jgi:cytoskeletal protein CcmA (bactofilin family)